MNLLTTLAPVASKPFTEKPVAEFVVNYLAHTAIVLPIRQGVLFSLAKMCSRALIATSIHRKGFAKPYAFHTVKPAYLLKAFT
jgi:hypothetical protein